MHRRGERNRKSTLGNNNSARFFSQRGSIAPLAIHDDDDGSGDVGVDDDNDDDDDEDGEPHRDVAD